MAIKAITPINFTSYSNRTQNTMPANSKRHSSSTLKTFPVVVLLATMPAKAADSIQPAGVYFPHVNKIEQVDQDKNDVDIINRTIIRNKNEACRFTQYNTDNIHEDAEVLGFNYKVKRQDGSIGSLTGIFQAICPDKTDDNKYLVTYDPVLQKKENEGIKTCYIPEEFGNYIMRFINSGKNNGAIDVIDLEEFEEAFGKEIIANSPEIKNAIEKITPLISKSDY